MGYMICMPENCDLGNQKVQPEDLAYGYQDCTDCSSPVVSNGHRQSPVCMRCPTRCVTPTLGLKALCGSTASAISALWGLLMSFGVRFRASTIKMGQA